MDNSQSFQANITASSAIPGNINVEGSSTVNHTVGLDCCGFITSAFKMEGHQSLNSFRNAVLADSANIKSSFSDLQQMDLIIMEHHIMFKYSDTEVYDCQSGRIIYKNEHAILEDEKTSLREMTDDEYNDCHDPNSSVIFYHVNYHDSHSYSTTWSYNSSNHWKACTVCGKKKNEAAHTAGSTWYTDGTYHWKKCTVCGYIMNKASHVILGTWYYNGTYHWRKCKICGADGPKSTHVYAGSGLTCSTCGYVRPLSIFALPEKKQEFFDV